MSTQQQALIMETILSMKRTLKRKAHESDSDSSIDQRTNRGNKLKKRARFVKQGRLASVGPMAYKEVADHAGHQRAIINHNPPLIDEDGYDIESDDDEEQIQEAIASAMEDNPYSSVRLEHILAPLTAVTDLPSHPTLSRPFTSKALTELIEQARNLMQKENAALWKAKPLLTKLVGDNTWAPCGLMIAPDDRDALLFSDTVSFFNRPAPHIPAQTTAGPSLVGGAPALQNTSTKSAQREMEVSEVQEAVSQPVGGAAQSKEVDKKAADGEILPDAHVGANVATQPDGGSSSGGNSGKHPQVNGKVSRQGEEDKDGFVPADDARSRPNSTGAEDVEMTEAPSAGPNTGEHHDDAPRPTERPAVSAPGSLPASDAPEVLDEFFIHPLFRLPPAAHPDRDLGLPEQEAEEVRRLLLLYVQKQEEICRGTYRLYEGLLKADRYRKTVWQWAKAEAHCGLNRDMSDGEDWYDKEAWGLTEDLKKGEDEVEEDTAQTQKKTRNRK
ncbi:hypothetical protein VTK56DRAFT_2914 [Thermocarpiscus australiensis]